MIQQITKGIKISVQSNFEGTFFKEQELFYAFSYNIKIENNTQDSVQLISRKWHILDALNKKDTVVGDGVVGEQPIIHPLEAFSYRSWCHLRAPFGAMKGYYKMLNFSNNETIEVTIPNFKLHSQFAQN